MSIKALVTVLVLGSSSVALADHTQLAPPPPAPVPAQAYHDQGFDARDQYMPGRWGRRPMSTLIASNVQLTSGFRDHRGQRPLFIDIDERMGGFSKLRFDLGSGFAYIDTVVVMLTNGTSRTYEVHQPLSYRSPSLTIDLDTRRITGMYVYGRSFRSNSGTFSVTGIRGGRFDRPMQPGY